MPRMAKPLVIVESPAKARTIARFLGGDFVVESSVGHIRDLPRNAADVPASHKGEPWARLGVDIENGFKPLYVVAKEKRHVVSDLKQKLKQASELYLATDEDREGSRSPGTCSRCSRRRSRCPCGAWSSTRSPRAPSGTRSTTGATSIAAWSTPRRRGASSTASTATRSRPCSGRRSCPGSSAGRVQSVATRILVERERARMRFRAAGYWDLEGTFLKAGADASFAATLVALDGRRLVTGKDFSEDGRLTRDERGAPRRGGRHCVRGPVARRRPSPCARSRRSPTSAHPRHPS